MQYTYRCSSPLGEMLLAADEAGLTGLWFEEQKYYAAKLEAERMEKKLPVFEETVKWLDIYFRGKEPDFTPPLHMKGTPFRQAVWEILCRIPYGQVITYGEIAKKIAEQRGISRMSAQAVGGAVGHNPISVIVPCHRVVGAGGNLTGYAGGIERKIRLLELEGKDRTDFFVPKRLTAENTDGYPFFGKFQ